MTGRTTDDALDLRHVLQESAESPRAFAVAACGLVTTGSREVRDSDLGSAKLFQTRSRIAQLRTRPEAGQVAKFFVVAGHPVTRAQELECSTSVLLLKKLRGVSCVPQGRMRTGPQSKNCHQRPTANIVKAERVLCRGRGPSWLHLHASCEVHRVSTMQSRFLDHVKDLVSRSMHLSLSLRMSGHMKRFRACMRTVVESEVDAVAGCSGEAAGFRLSPGAISLPVDGLSCGCGRNESAVEHYVDPAWTLRPDADIHFSANGESVRVSFRVKATVRVPSPSVDGVRPRLRRGRLVSSAPDLSCQRQATSGSGAARSSSSAAPAKRL